jgi:Uma2 family endonuclease
METIKSPAEQKVTLHNVRWETYERLMQERGESRVPRFAFDRGELEITSPQAEHESISYAAALLVEVLAEEMDVDVYGFGSATFKREDLERGFEPDQCFYFKNWELVRGKERLDVAFDPPPELVIGIDITSPSLNELPIYARLGVREVWRYDGERMRIRRTPSEPLLAASHKRCPHALRRGGREARPHGLDARSARVGTKSRRFLGLSGLPPPDPVSHLLQPGHEPQLRCLLVPADVLEGYGHDLPQAETAEEDGYGRVVAGDLGLRVAGDVWQAGEPQGFVSS